MDKQDQENSRDESNQDRDDVNRSIKEDEKAGSVSSSSGRIVVRLKVPPEMVGPTPPPPEKTHFCKECDKAFSSGKALGGHMSSAHVQQNNYSSSSSSRKLKSRKNRFEVSGPYSGRAWRGGDGGNVCVVCDRRFPTHKSLHGHMRCHPDRGWKGVEPPVRPLMDLWDEEPTEPGSEYTGLDQESLDDDDDADDDKDYREYVDSGLDYVTGPVDLLSSLGRVPAAAKRGRSVRTEVVSSPVSGLEEEEQAVAAGHQLLRLLKRGDLDSGKKTSGDADKSPSSDTMARHEPESDGGVRAVNAPNTQTQDLKNKKAPDGKVAIKPFIENNRKGNDKIPDYCDITGPNTQKQDLMIKAPDRKKQKVSSFVPKLKIENTNGTLHHGTMIENNRKSNDKIDYKGKTKIDYTGKGKAILSESDQSDDTASESDDDELYFNAIKVLTNVQGESHRPDYRIPAADVSARSKPVEKPSPARRKEDGSSTTSGLSSPEKFVCTTCKKVFPTHQALGGHRSSHNKFKIHIVNTIDEVKPAKGDNVVNVGRRANVDDDDNNPHVCNICNKRFATGRALGGHKKCHNSDAAGTSISNNNNNNNGDEEKEKVVRAFDLNLMPDENEDDDDM